MTQPLKGQRRTNMTRGVAARMRAEIDADQTRYVPDALLDTYREIASRLRVSIPTVHRAMLILSDEGIVTLGGPGVRARIAGPTPSRQDEQAAIAQTLRTEWGTLPAGTPVPGQEHLAGRFGVSSEVIRKIERRLIRDGVIDAPTRGEAPRTAARPCPRRSAARRQSS